MIPVAFVRLVSPPLIPRPFFDFLGPFDALAWYTKLLRQDAISVRPARLLK